MKDVAHETFLKDRATVLLILIDHTKENSNLLNAVFAILPFSLAKFAQNSHFFDKFLFINVVYILKAILRHQSLVDNSRLQSLVALEKNYPQTL